MTPVSRPRPGGTRRTPLTPVFDGIRALGFRRTRPRLVGGVAAGLAANTGVDVWLMRLVLVLVGLLPVLDLGGYLVVWALTPWEDGVIPAEHALSGA
ncbi:PspC domain-containing protein [Micrococcus porci]|uniref:PspC domain-containing protein n=1 Tax=Micrococcus porci TaxID=2856555 RepID=UPI003CE8690C